jgi:single-strand DNA-binding protein
MAGSVNKVIIVGNVGRDPERTNFQSGGGVTKLSIATSESWTDKRSNEKVERTQWHQIAIFNDALAEIVDRYVVKGSKLYVEGQLENRKWTDKDNIERYSTEVVLRPFSGSITLLGDPRSDRYPDDDVRDEPAEAPTRSEQPRRDRSTRNEPTGRR